MTQYACVQCCQPAEPGDYDCPCGGALAEVLEPHPAGIRLPQVKAICRHFSAQGEVNKQRRLRRLSKFTGRAIWDYWDLTQAEAAALLRTWTHGRLSLWSHPA